MEEDQEVIKKLMSMLGSGKEIKFKSPNGQTIRVSLDGSCYNETEPESEKTHTQQDDQRQNQDSLEFKAEEEMQKNASDKDYQCNVYEMIQEDFEDIQVNFNALSQHKEKDQNQELIELNLETFDHFDDQQIQKIQEIHSQSSKNDDNIFKELICNNNERPKKVLLSNKNKTETNESMINFFKQQQGKIKLESEVRNEMENTISISSSPIISRMKEDYGQRTNYRSQTVKESIALLKQNHPEDKDAIELINRRLIELQEVQKRVDESLSILNSSISNSLKFDSIDISMLSSFNQPSSSDPLCYIFAQFLNKAKDANKINSNSVPSFLFMYSQPLVDSQNREITSQINYFQQELIIQKILREGKCRVDYIHESATVDKFHYWIKQGVEILHFCGHGVKAQQNYLLFENDVAESVKVTAQKLIELLNEQIRPLKLVFVASCHSQSTGKVFSEAGASHVICIRDEYQILDQACQDFVKIFYLTCINNKTTICETFEFAKKQLTLKGKFSKHQCQKFMLICNHKKSDCKQHFQPRSEIKNFNDLNPHPYYNKNLPSGVEHYIPRCKELHQILQLINQKRRFITIFGQSGIGKSTLARELVRYIQFRNYFKDGVVYLELSRCENIGKIYEVLDLELFETPQLKLNKTPSQNANKLIKQLSQKHLLLVFDNCHSIMTSDDRESFKRLAESIMKNCMKVYFIFTNRHSIGRQIDFCSQALYQLGRLTDSQAESLFFQKNTRHIQKKQFDDFFSLENNSIEDIKRHSFFQFLNGHPEAICLTSSLLAYRSLSQLYQLLLKPNISDQFNEGIENKYNPSLGMNKVVETAMKISLNVIHHKFKEASEMIKILSLLPNGLDMEMMSKIFSSGGKWKQTVKKLMSHSLIQCIQKTGCKYYIVHPHIIIDVENELSQEQKIRYHERICEELVKRLQKIYRNVGTLSQYSQRAQELFLLEEDNYKTIFLRQMSFIGDKYPLRKFYEDVFKVEATEEQQNETTQRQITDNQILANIEANKKKKTTQTDRNVQKKQSLDIVIIYFVTILFVVRKVKNSPIENYLNYGLVIGQKRNKYLVVANLLRIKACIYLAQGKDANAKVFFQTARVQFAQLGCGLGTACCQAAIGYIKFFCEQQYASAKMNLQNALKYYDEIPHPFGKHYLNRWLCSLKSKMNRGQRQLINHKLQAQKLLKETKSNLRSNNINNTSLIKHKFGYFVFRFLFDNISLFLQASFQADLRPKYIVSNVIASFTMKQQKDKKNILYDINEEKPKYIAPSVVSNYALKSEKQKKNVLDDINEENPTPITSSIVYKNPKVSVVKKIIK